MYSGVTLPFWNLEVKHMVIKKIMVWWPAELSNGSPC